MKIILLGKNGQVGTALGRTLPPFGELLSLGRSDLNLENLTALKRLLAHEKPDVIVNAAAYTAVDKAETAIDAAYLINARLVELLATYASLTQCLFVHYSTDYVFDGTKASPYIESDPCHPHNVYGLSKRAGEKAILASQAPFLIFRTSWVFSDNGHNFIKTILKLAKEKERLTIVADQYGAPTSAELIADITALAIAGYYQKSLKNGIYHLTASGFTNWYELACYAVKQSLRHEIPLKLQSENITPISTEDYPTPAKRPKNSKLDTSALSSALGLTLPDWRIYVDRMIQTLARRDNTFS